MYSFSAKGATKADALANVLAEFDRRSAATPPSPPAADRAHVKSSAESSLGALPEAGGNQEYVVAVSTGSASASLQTKE